jgi:translation elongation factor Ts
MMDCKKALERHDGDLEKAADWLREQGASVAAKKAGREAGDGLIGSYIHAGGKIGVLVEVNCETDFVARNPEFKPRGRDLVQPSPNPTTRSTSRRISQSALTARVSRKPVGQSI